VGVLDCPSEERYDGYAIKQKKEKGMAQPILNGKSILMVDDEPDILEVLEKEITEACPDCTIEKATTYEKAAELLKSHEYDLIILDIMGVKGFDLLDIAVKRDFLVAMLTAHSLSPESLRKSHDLGARAFLPKDKLGEIVPFLEDVLRYDFENGWKRLRSKLEDLLPERYWDFF
jgi:CheY-like chemotaxis protein